MTELSALFLKIIAFISYLKEVLHLLQQTNIWY
ncbi:hypothetical protein OKW21_003244 [Catalinimonas alkaloidigena]|nr:hypothetical protein [Catalinimonas alkaloidigena]